MAKPAAPRPSTKTDDILASLQQSVKKPAAKDPLKGLDDLLSSVGPKGRHVAKVEAARSEPETVEESLGDVFGEEQKFMELATDLSSDLASLVADTGMDEAPESDAAILGDIFNEFKKGVDEQLDADDYETRYNLGIAYKEMGLVDEAIREFQVAGTDPTRAVECCSMLGLCFMEKGDADSAVTWFTKGLQANGQTPEQLLGLHYDLGQAFEMMGDHSSALDAYRKVHTKAPQHRNVGERIRRLEATV